MSEASPALGLRERQQRQALRQIHLAARELVEANGFSATTVTQIAQRAGVSRRTFFNYYATKEDAVLGLSETKIPEDALDEYLAHQDQGDRLGRIVVLLARTTLTLRQDSGVSRQEMLELAKHHAQLRERLHQRFQEVQERLTVLALEKLQESGEDCADTNELAEALIALAGAVLKLSVRKNPDIFDTPTREAFDPVIRAFQAALKDVK